MPDGHSYGYMTSKAAQLGLMKSLAQELVSKKILVNAIAPGAIATRMVPDEVYDVEVAAVPLGRLGEADEIAAAVAFLASDEASFITGQTLAVNGGVWFSPDAPFGGYKQSGIGREMGVAGFEEYLETKTIAEPA